MNLDNKKYLDMKEIIESENPVLKDVFLGHEYRHKKKFFFSLYLFFYIEMDLKIVNKILRWLPNIIQKLLTSKMLKHSII